MHLQAMYATPKVYVKLCPSKLQVKDMVFAKIWSRLHMV